MKKFINREIIMTLTSIIIVLIISITLNFVIKIDIQNRHNRCKHLLEVAKTPHDTMQIYLSIRDCIPRR